MNQMYAVGLQINEKQIKYVQEHSYSKRRISFKKALRKTSVFNFVHDCVYNREFTFCNNIQKNETLSYNVVLWTYEMCHLKGM